MEPAPPPVELFGLAKVGTKGWAVIGVTVEDNEVTDKVVYFEPEPRDQAFQNLKVTLVRHFFES